MKIKNNILRFVILILFTELFMINIISPNDDFDFSTIYLGYPTSQNGSFFTKIYCQGKALYIQTPKSQTKQGFVKMEKRYIQN